MVHTLMEEAEPLLISLCQGLPTGRLETGANSHWCLSPARNITSKPDVENNKTNQEYGLSTLALLAWLQPLLMVVPGTPQEAMFHQSSSSGFKMRNKADL